MILFYFVRVFFLTVLIDLDFINQLTQNIRFSVWNRDKESNIYGSGVNGMHATDYPRGTDKKTVKLKNLIN